MKKRGGGRNVRKKRETNEKERGEKEIAYWEMTRRRKEKEEEEENRVKI